QENKSDVRAIMARFQASGASTDETSSTPAGRGKQPLHPTLSSGPTPHRKPVLESLSGSAINVPPKPTFLKNTVSTKSDTDAHEPSKAKALASRFSSAQDDTNNKPFTVNKQHTPVKPPFSQAPETKGLGPKPPLNKPSLSSTLSESKPAFPKPAPVLSSKPSWVKEDSNGGAALNTSSTPPKIPNLQQKPTSSIGKLRQHVDEAEGANTDAANKPSPFANSTFKGPSNFRTAQNMFNKEKDKTEQADGGVVNKPPLTATKSIPPPKPPVNKKPSLRKPPKASPVSSSVNGDATSEPKRNPLPNTFALGPPPAKPNRPPKVNLENFKRGAEASNDGKSDLVNGCRTTDAIVTLYNHLQYVIYNNFLNNYTSTADSFMLLVLKREAAEQKQDKKKEKEEKEEKKRLETEKKEQKEREKKEQDARKKFKLSGPIEVIHQGKARVDCRGGKTDLALKQGDSLDIIRVQGNPEGKWLGRSQDGSIGYVKTTSVEIDFNTLKKRQVQQAYDPEVYDDIDVVSDNRYSESGTTTSVLKPVIKYHESNVQIDDFKSVNRVPFTFFFFFFWSSLPVIRGKSRSEDMDPKKQKKFEKEEKEFRKKFKYEGEVQVLYQVTITNTLNNKKWSAKELPLKAGERLDVIVKAVDNKLICRNDDGKCEYLYMNTSDPPAPHRVLLTFFILASVSQL
uniref:FYN binding protein b n=1 Tax=Stegastes partitus TaxID=144197 RepID=A0A3B5A0N9_9TELE